MGSLLTRRRCSAAGLYEPLAAAPAAVLARLSSVALWVRISVIYMHALVSAAARAATSHVHLWRGSDRLTDLTVTDC